MVPVFDWWWDLGSKWWTQVSSPMALCNKKFSHKVFYWCKRSVVTAVLVSVCHYQLSVALSWWRANLEIAKPFSSCHYTALIDG